MAYKKTTWKDRVVERPRTFTLENNPDGSVTLRPAEGEIFEPGVPIIAKNMNNIEEKVEELDSKQIIVSSAQPEGHVAGRVWIQTIE